MAGKILDALEIEWITQQPAPDSLLNFVTCNCKKSKCQTGVCQCCKNNIQCTDLCNCNNCQNGNDGDDTDEFHSDEESSDAESDVSGDTYDD